MTRLLIITTALTCVCFGYLRTSELQDSDYEYLYWNQAIEDCSEPLRNLAGCLRGDLSVVVKIRVCNRIMADVFTCLTRKPEEDVTAPAQEEVFVKRGLGRCINQCLRGPDRMSFIQCKSMCHK